MSPLPGSLKKAAKFLLLSFLAALHLWALLALYFWFMGPSLPALLVCAIYGLGVWGSFRLAKTRSHGALVSSVLFLVIAAWWTRREPRNDFIYTTDTAESARTETERNLLTISGIRDFRYHSVDNFDERWATRTYDLDKLRAVDLYFVHWGVPGVAHVITSFVFDDSAPLAVSIELRREQDEPNTLLRGIFKQYEVHYVWSDERDVIQLRTNFRKEEVYLHRTDLTPEQARKMLLSMASRTNWLNDHPEFYNTLTDSCANAIRLHLQQARGQKSSLFGQPLSPAGYEKLGYDEGWLLHAKPDFQADREASHINARAQTVPGAPAPAAPAETTPDDHPSSVKKPDDDFSTRIRTHLPLPAGQEQYPTGQ